MIERFLCEFYGKQNIVEKKSPDPEQILPIRDSFMLHLKRANYVTCIWKQALISYPEKLNLADHGWKIDKFQLSIKICWSILKPDPDAMMEMISYRSKTGTCTTNRC